MRISQNIEIKLACINNGGFVYLCSTESRADVHEMKKKPDSLRVWVKHDEGVTWPKPEAISLIEDALNSGKSVLLEFVLVDDAITCHDRMQRERGQ